MSRLCRRKRGLTAWSVFALGDVHSDSLEHKNIDLSQLLCECRCAPLALKRHQRVWRALRDFDLNVTLLHEKHHPGRTPHLVARRCTSCPLAWKGLKWTTHISSNTTCPLSRARRSLQVKSTFQRPRWSPVVQLQRWKHWAREPQFVS